MKSVRGFIWIEEMSLRDERLIYNTSNFNKTELSTFEKTGLRNVFFTILPSLIDQLKEELNVKS